MSLLKERNETHERNPQNEEANNELFLNVSAEKLNIVFSFFKWVVNFFRNRKVAKTFLMIKILIIVQMKTIVKRRSLFWQTQQKKINQGNE